MATDPSTGLSTGTSIDTPTDAVFSIGNDSGINASGGTYVAYCFAPITGYSAMGSYAGNGNADGTFIYTGFRPAYVIIKKTSGGADWFMWDNTP